MGSVSILPTALYPKQSISPGHLGVLDKLEISVPNLHNLEISRAGECIGNCETNQPNGTSRILHSFADVHSEWVFFCKVIFLLKLNCIHTKNWTTPKWLQNEQLFCCRKSEDLILGKKHDQKFNRLGKCACFLCVGLFYYNTHLVKQAYVHVLLFLYMCPSEWLFSLSSMFDRTLLSNIFEHSADYVMVKSLLFSYLLHGQEAVGDTLEELWISYNLVEKLKGIQVLKKLKVGILKILLRYTCILCSSVSIENHFFLRT